MCTMTGQTEFIIPPLCTGLTSYICTPFNLSRYIQNVHCQAHKFEHTQILRHFLKEIETFLLVHAMLNYTSHVHTVRNFSRTLDEEKKFGHIFPLISTFLYD